MLLYWRIICNVKIKNFINKKIIKIIHKIIKKKLNNFNTLPQNKIAFHYRPMIYIKF